MTNRALPVTLLAIVTAFVPSASFAPPDPITALAPAEIVLDGRSELVGVAVAPDGTIFVSDRVAGVVHAVGPRGDGAISLGGLKHPAGLALDPAGHLLIAEEGAGRVVRREESGTLTPIASGLTTPRWIAALADGTVYVSAQRLDGVERPDSAPGFASVDGPERAEGHAIVRLSPHSPMQVVAGGIRHLQGLAVRDGGLVAAAKGLFGGPDAPGTVLHYPILPGGALGAPTILLHTGVKQPVGLATDILGASYVSSKEEVADGARGGVGKIHDDAHLTAFARGLQDPRGMAFGPDGSLYVADGHSGRLLRFHAPVSTLNAVPSFTNQSPVQLAGTTEPGARVDVFVNDAPMLSVTSDAAGAFAAPVSLAVNTRSVIDVFATGHDGDGLTSVPAEATVVHDTTPPTLRFHAPPPGAFVRQGVNVQVQASDTGSAVASITVMADTQLLTATPTPAPSLTAVATWDTIAVSDGGHTLTATATDRAGNRVSATRVVVVDNTPPRTRILTGPTGTIGETSAVITFGGSDNMTDPSALRYAWRVDGGDWSSSSQDSSASLTSLAAGLHRFEVKARDLAGNEDPTPATIEFTVRPLQLRITSPSDGSRVPAGLVVVRGAVDAAGQEVGVIVNGVTAAVHGNAFAAALRVDAGMTTIVAQAATAAGLATEHRIVVGLDATEATPLLRVTPHGGAAPVTVGFSISDLAGIIRLELDADGDGQTDFVGTDLSGFSFTYAASGIFFPRLTVTTDDGRVATVSTSVEILDRTALDAVLGQKWSAFRAALAANDVEAALTVVASAQREKYRAALLALSPDLPALAAELRDIQPRLVNGGIAEFVTVQERDGRRYVHFIYFVRDEDGLWKIISM